MSDRNCPCYKCEDRERLVAKFGNCHNKHCPNGYLDWNRERLFKKEIISMEQRRLTGIKKSRKYDT